MNSEPTKKKYAYFRIGPHPIPNRILAEEFPRRFPQYELVIFDVKNEIRSRPHIVALNFLAMLWEYRGRLLRSDLSWKQAFLGTTFIFRWIKRLAARSIDPSRFAFTFQSDSLYDASVRGIPHFVYTDHTNLANLTYTAFKQNKVKPPAWVALEKTIYENAKLIFTRSTNITRSLMEQYGISAGKIVRVGAGSNVQLPPSEGIERDYRNKNILFVGVDWERKGGPELVQAFQRVLEIHPDAHLTIVGCTPKISVRNCHVVGRVPLEQIVPYYQQASIFCMPTRLEPFGVVFIEAFHFKLPIVATNVGATPDFIIDGTNGYLVEPGDIEVLSARLIDLLENPARCRSMGEEGYRLVRQSYSWEQVSKAIAVNINQSINDKKETDI